VGKIHTTKALREFNGLTRGCCSRDTKYVRFWPVYERYAPLLSPAAVLLCSAVDPIDEAWARVEADWGDEEAHRRFVGVCVALQRLPEAGKRYRHVRETDASRSEDAARQIDRLLVLATQQLEDTKVVRGTTEHKRTLTWAAFFIMLMLMGAGAWLLLRV